MFLFHSTTIKLSTPASDGAVVHTIQTSSAKYPGMYTISGIQFYISVKTNHVNQIRRASELNFSMVDLNL